MQIVLEIDHRELASRKKYSLIIKTRSRVSGELENESWHNRAFNSQSHSISTQSSHSQSERKGARLKWKLKLKVQISAKRVGDYNIRISEVCAM